MNIPSFKIEQELYKKGVKLICGIDEVGRGAWAGPLVVGAVILRTDKKIYKVRDSKTLTLKNREKLLPIILENIWDYAVGEVSNKEIDKFGLSRAIKLAGKRCLENLKLIPEIVLLDGKWNYLSEEIEVKTIVGGDKKSSSIAAASIVAKVTRDRLLVMQHKKYPHYNFHKNKGYGTKEHQETIRKHGLSKIHRKSYNLSK